MLFSAFSFLGSLRAQVETSSLLFFVPCLALICWKKIKEQFVGTISAAWVLIVNVDVFLWWILKWGVQQQAHSFSFFVSLFFLGTFQRIGDGQGRRWLKSSLSKLVVLLVSCWMRMSVCLSKRMCVCVSLLTKPRLGEKHGLFLTPTSSTPSPSVSVAMIRYWCEPLLPLQKLSTPHLSHCHSLSLSTSFRIKAVQ